MAYDIYVLEENAITLSGGAVLDGVTQGDGSHLVGETLTIDSASWFAVSINDNDTDFRDNDGSQDLDGPVTLNGVTYADGTVAEAEYGLTLSDGVNTWQVVAFNVRDSTPPYATIEGLAFVGGPGGFPPVGVPLTIVSAQEGPHYESNEYATPICFATGTLIETETGLRPVEDICVGELVLTADDGFQPVRWLAQRSFPAFGDRAPIVFAPGSIGNDRELVVSPQHRIQVDDWRAQLICGEDAVLIPAKAFVNGRDVAQRVGGVVTYCHLMFDRHQIVFAEGVATESFHPGEVGVSGLDRPARRELVSLFPELADNAAAYGSAALPDVRGDMARVLLAA